MERRQFDCALCGSAVRPGEQWLAGPGARPLCAGCAESVLRWPALRRLWEWCAVAARMRAAEGR